MKRNGQRVIFAILSLLTVVFIFSNSMQKRETSNARSESIADKIKPVIGVTEDPATETAEVSGQVDWVNHYVRKAAHMAEFALLGFFAMGLSDTAPWKKWLQVIAAAGVVLAVGAADETIQLFIEERGPSVKDVGIDFIGGALGIGMMLGLLMLRRRRGRV